MHIIKAQTPADAWVKSTGYLLENGYWIHNIQEILNVCVVIDSKPVDNSQLHKLKLFDDLFRLIFGDDRVDYASSVTFIPPKNDGLFDRRTYTFLGNKWKDSYWGRMVAYRGEINQIENAIKLLSQGKNIKRCQVMVYDPIIDMKNMYKQPCLLGIDFKPRDGKLYMTAFFRSQRVSKSGYADYIALNKLRRFVAKESNLKVGTLETIACSFHLTKDNKEYKNSLKLLELLEEHQCQF